MNPIRTNCLFGRILERNDMASTTSSSWGVDHSRRAGSQAVADVDLPDVLGPRTHPTHVIEVIVEEARFHRLAALWALPREWLGTSRLKVIDHVELPLLTGFMSVPRDLHEGRASGDQPRRDIRGKPIPKGAG